MSRLIDTHFHLDHYSNYNEIAKTITELKQYTICVTNSPGVFLSCKHLIPETKYLKFAIGMHPSERELDQSDLRLFIRLVEQTKYIGEVGLDFSSKYIISKTRQLLFFETIVDYCSTNDKMMTVHLRGSETDAIRILRKYAPKKCIIHWFTGNEKMMTELVDLGCFFSINSNMTLSRDGNKYQRIPISRILIESDGPYTKVCGKQYYPELLRQTYESVAKFYNNPDMEDVVFSNFRAILGL